MSVSPLFSVDGVERSSGLAERGIEGSRGLQSTDREAGRFRRGATIEKEIRWDGLASVAPRRGGVMARPWAEAHGYRLSVAPRHSAVA